MVLFVLCFLMSFGCVAQESSKSGLFIERIYIEGIRFTVVSPKEFSLDLGEEPADDGAEEGPSLTPFIKDLQRERFETCWLSPYEAYCFSPEYHFQLMRKSSEATFFDNDFYRKNIWFFGDLLIAIVTKKYIPDNWRKKPKFLLFFLKKLACSILDLYAEVFTYLWGGEREGEALALLETQISILKGSRKLSDQLIIAALGDPEVLAGTIHGAKDTGRDRFSSDTCSSVSMTSGSDDSGDESDSE